MTKTLMFMDFVASFSVEAFYLHWLYREIINDSSRKKTNALNLLIPIGYILTFIFFKFIPCIVDAFIVQTLGVVFPFLLSYFVFRKNTSLKIYISVTFLATKYLRHCFFLLFNEIIYKVILFFNSVLFQQGYSYDSVQQLILFFIQVILTFLIRWGILHVVIRTVVKYCRGKENVFNLRDIIFLLIPSVAGIFWGLMISRFVIDEFQNEISLGVLLLIAVGTLVFVASIAVDALLLQQMKETQEEEKERLLVSRQIQNISGHIEKVEGIYEGIRGIRHDMNNHFSNIENLLESEDYAELKEYIGQFKAAVEPFDTQYHTCNPVTDIIVNEYADASKRKGISFDSDFIFPNGMDINAFDVSIILQNGLENAMEACELIKMTEEKHVFLHSVKKNNTYLIQIKNSFYDGINWEDGKLPQTVKEDKKMHGLGLKNIRKIAEKYHGGMDIECRDQEFILSVMIQNK